MSNVVGFVLNQDDIKLVNDLKEEDITTADILRNSLEFYHKSIFNENSILLKKQINIKKESENDRYVKHLEKELKFWKKKHEVIERKFQNFVNDTLEKMDDTFKMMLANKYELQNLKKSKKDVSPKEKEWISTSKKLDHLFKNE
jgi:hypothetical protein